MVTAGAGSRTAKFEALVVPLLEPAYRAAYRMTGRAAEAEDLVQEAWAAVDGRQYGRP